MKDFNIFWGRGTVEPTTLIYIDGAPRGLWRVQSTQIQAMREASTIESLKAIIKPTKSQSFFLSPFTQNSEQHPWWSLLPSGGRPSGACLTPPEQQYTSCIHFLNPKCHRLGGLNHRNYFSPSSGSKKSKVKELVVVFFFSLCLHMVSPPCVSLSKFALLRGTPVMSD